MKIVTAVFVVSLGYPNENAKKMTDIIGNQQQIRNLELWLDSWDDCILHGHKKEQSKITKTFKKYENVNARAAIISGPPGIGKTSTIRVLAKTKGYRTFELNASDKRNKDTINNSVGFLMNNTTLSSIDNSTMTKNIIIMDEIDRRESGFRLSCVRRLCRRKHQSAR